MTRTGSTRYVTAVGRQRLQNALAAALENHQEICTHRQMAFELSGDGWHDNPHFNHLQQLEATATKRVAELRAQLASVRVVEVIDGERPVERARLGSLVLLSISSASTAKTERRLMEIVGFQEGDDSGSKVPYDAPLAAAILGKASGDIVTAQLPSGAVEIELLDLFASTAEAKTDDGE